MRPALSIHAPARRQATKARFERMLDWISADSAMIDALLGDLAEERADRQVRDGRVRAQAWYLAEAARSVPWIVASAVRYGGARAQARVAGLLAIVAFLVTGVVAVLLGMAGDPARLIVVGDAGDGVVVNNVSAVQLGMKVLDARGHLLPDSGVRYRWMGGAPVPLSTRGVAKCTRSGDARVRATLNGLSTDLLLRCRPVTAMYGSYQLAIIIGDAPNPIPFRALDVAGHVVSPLRGQIVVGDTSIVATQRAADGQRLLRGLRTGGTRVEVTVGDKQMSTYVSTFRRAESPTGILPGDQVAVRVRLQQHEVREWRLSPSLELYTIRMLPERDEEMPYLAIVSANCVHIDAHAFMCAAPRGGSVYAYFPAWDVKSYERSGNLAVERRDLP